MIIRYTARISQHGQTEKREAIDTCVYTYVGAEKGGQQRAGHYRVFTYSSGQWLIYTPGSALGQNLTDESTLFFVRTREWYREKPSCCSPADRPTIIPPVYNIALAHLQYLRARDLVAVCIPPLHFDTLVSLPRSDPLNVRLHNNEKR